MKDASALAGLKVLDFTRVLSGPLATMTLADLGADVIKVERPDGDDTRHWGPPFVNDESTYFLGLNRNKKSVVLDLKSSQGKETAIRLMEDADVLVENFRPGTMDGLGLGYEFCRERNPSLIYCSLTGFGTRAGASLPGYDFLVQAVGGLMSITGEAEGSATKVGVALVDVVAGLFACIGILAAITERNESGLGQRVETNLLASCLTALANQASSFVATGEIPGRLGNAHPSIAPYESFGAADRDIVLAVGTDRQFADLCTVLGLDGAADDPRFKTNAKRVDHRDELRELIATALGDKPAGEWVDMLQDQSVPAGVVNDIREAFGLAADLGLDPIRYAEDGGRDVPTVANPISLSRTPVTYRRSAPRLDEHGTEIKERAGAVSDNNDERGGFKRPPTAQAAVLEEIRTRILARTLRPGDPIRPEAIGEELGVSRVPVRDALKILEGEGQVAYVPHRGYFVAELSLSELLEVYRIREILEEEAACQGIPGMEAEDLSRMEIATADMDAASEASDIIAHTVANRRYHFTIYEASKMSHLVRLIRLLWDSTEPYRALYYNDSANRERVKREHVEIVDAIRSGETERAIELLNVHRRHAIEALAQILN